ncbi:hypothetical protein chiPu_0002596 [Chiloscyllium punctatum]|uniref:Uncharacterized protein n=1 Tax=Chiloscyllium punctatum TaxID=137246 RepID=A0A401S1E0_CHIPU|nr:hypothetical protein [Chiloscyllium punctatum]
MKIGDTRITYESDLQRLNERVQRRLSVAEVSRDCIANIEKSNSRFQNRDCQESFLSGVRFPGFCLFSCRFLSWEPLAVILFLRETGDSALGPGEPLPAAASRSWLEAAPRPFHAVLRAAPYSIRALSRDDTALIREVMGRPVRAEAARGEAASLGRRARGLTRAAVRLPHLAVRFRAGDLLLKLR